MLNFNITCSDNALREILTEEEVLASISEAGFTKPLLSVTVLEKNSIHHYYIPPFPKGIYAYIAFVLNLLNMSCCISEG